jgi:hypothetical protein
LLECKGCVLKLAIGAKSICALDILEDWEQNCVVAASPEALHTNHVKWINVVFRKKLLFDYELTSSEKLSTKKKQDSSESCGGLV